MTSARPLHLLMLNSQLVGGGPSSTVELATGLVAAGHRVTFACHPDGEVFRRLQAGERLEVVPLALQHEFHLGPMRQLRRLIRERAPDAILANKRMDVRAAVLARGGGRTPPLLHREGAPEPIKDHPFHRWCWRRVQAMVLNSEAMRARYLAERPWMRDVPLYVVPNGKDLARWRPLPERRTDVRAALGLDTAAYVPCFHGQLYGRKRVDELIRAAAPLVASHRLRLLVVGDGEGRTALEALARELGVPAVFTGLRRDIPELLAAADVAVNLATSEGFANSVVEALACGLPVVATDAHSHREQVQDGVTGRLVPPRDVAALTRALAEFADPARRTSASRAARADAEARFGLAAMVAGYVGVLEEVRGKR